MLKSTSAFLLFLSLLCACTVKKKSEKSLLRAALGTDSQGTCERLLSPTEYRNLASQLLPTDPLVVVSTNDLHGHADERIFNLKVSETESHSVIVGGLERLESYLTAACRSAKGRLLYLDAGDSYQGTALSNSTSGQAIVDSFSALGLMASTFGNHEFDFGQDKIKSWLSQPTRTFWYVTSSVNSSIDGKNVPWSELNAPRFSRSVVFNIAGIKVGIAGYTTDSTAVKSIPDNIKDISFNQLNGVLLNEAEPLRKQGAQVTILLSHAGGACDMTMPAEHGDKACKENDADELGRALRAHPNAASQWNLIVAGHSHSPQRHIVAGVPVMQTSGLGLSMAHARIKIHKNTATTDLQDPVYLCDQHFDQWNGCHPEEWEWKSEKIQSLGKPKKPSLLGQLINKDEGNEVKAILEPYRNSLKSFMDKNITSFSSELKHERTSQSPAAACLVDAWLSHLRSSDEKWGELSSKNIDIAFLNAGALRSGISSGSLTWGRLFEIIPYDNTAHIVSLTSSELISFARAHESSPHDYLLASDGWAVRRQANSNPSPRTIEVKRISTLPIAKQKWTVAISTFSKSFLERAKIDSQVYDSGLSIRASIGSTLERFKQNINSCNNADSSRMQIVTSGNGE
jgi:2',3'-cyclic-nucleotide 2'-phosphodiesterase (5'-nucleotidase family)